ncbi:MAG TPA: TrmH family RNA methyltransferase [Nocardioidaceae bacterium]|nr:TrmH family RNA methyltransferase [Nocardioidaceae bacterium]
MDGSPRVITSASNARVRWLASLRKRSVRDAQGLTVVEGYAELSLALDAGGVAPRVLAYSPELVRDDVQATLLGRAEAAGAELLRLGPAAFARASYRESPDGWLGVVPSPERPLADVALSSNPLVLVADRVEKPGNLGAMARTAEAVGADAVVAADAVGDWGNPNAVRASKGTVFAVPVAAARSAEVLSWLRAHSVAVLVATPEGDSLVTETDLSGPTAVVVGAEHEGVGDGWRGSADHLVRLPMHGTVNSLNVATTAAVLLYEALRQRS